MSTGALGTIIRQHQNKIELFNRNKESTVESALKVGTSKHKVIVNADLIVDGGLIIDGTNDLASLLDVIQARLDVLENK